MVKKKPSANLTPGEQFAGSIFLIVYLLVLPWATGPLFRLVGEKLGRTIHGDLQSAVYYYALFAVTVVIFHGFLVRTSQRLTENLPEACKSVVVGLVAMYGLNELLDRLLGALLNGRVNLNDSAISTRIGSTPHMTVLTVLFLAPFVEEVLFRGLLFGSLRSRGRGVAYAASCLVFALPHVWQFALENRDAAYLLLGLRYLAPAAALAWAYEHSGTLWASIGLHAAANGLSLLSMMNRTI